MHRMEIIMCHITDHLDAADLPIYQSYSNRGFWSRSKTDNYGRS